MQYKDIDFTIENAEKYPDAQLLRPSGISKHWEVGKRGVRLFYFDMDKSWEWDSISFAIQHFKLRIPVEYRKMNLYYKVAGFDCNTGYFIHIDEQGNPIGEPFKTEQ